MNREPHDAKRVFREQGTCSRTFFYLLNREFEQMKETEERASDSLAGGIMQRGYQCGMLWGSALAVGAEAYRRCEELDQAMRVAVLATQQVMDSFSERENTVNCRDITHCDFSSKWSFAKYFLTGRFLYCFKMAEQWAPNAVQAALEGLSADKMTYTVGRPLSKGEEKTDGHFLNCASLTAQKLGASDEEMVMVAGFAGGLGLSGGGCGALSAAIWMRSLSWCRENEGKSSFKNPEATKTMEDFEKSNDDEMLCSTLTGRSFKTVEEHSDFIEEGGCRERIQALAATVTLD